MDQEFSDWKTTGSSQWIDVTSGIPQGSILGSLLVILCMLMIQLMAYIAH